jgi:hypothetical protein
MKQKILASFLVLAVALVLLAGLAFKYQSAQASTPHFSVAIIGGAIIAHKPSHITIATTPGAHVGMRIFYRCSSSVIRIVYPNQTANSLGRYTWGWGQGAPCSNGGNAVVIVTGSKIGQIFVAQKTFPIVLPPSPGVNGNPWGYNFTPGKLIYSPAAAFCTYFSCVSSFWTSTNGYVAECYNGAYTHSAGVRGACSRDGGVERPLYSH